jgi:hypothetical protein
MDHGDNMAVIKQSILNGIITIVVAFIIVLISSSFSSISDVQGKEIAQLKIDRDENTKQIIELRLYVSQQSEWNRNVLEILKELKNEKINKSNYK